MNGTKGFTISELLVSLVFLIIIIVLLIPLFMTARERATQKSTIVDMKKWADAINSYIVDYSTAPTNPQGRLNYKKAIIQELSPYLNAVHTADWWGYPFQIWTGKGVHQYGLKTEDQKEFIISSFGRYGNKEGWKYDHQNPESGSFNVNKLEDFENDLIIWNSRFIRYPKGFSQTDKWARRKHYKIQNNKK